MAESYSDSTAGESVGSRLFDDRTLKWVGVAIAGAFTLAIAAFLAYIVVVQVDFSLLVEVIYPQFTDAFLTVLRIVVISSVLSVVAGVVVGLGRVSQTRFTRSIARGYIEFFRGTPLLFQLMVVFLGVPTFWPPGEFPIQNFSRFRRPSSV